MAKLWGGRFSQGMHPLLAEFSVSVRYEDRLVPYDIQGSIAHAQMLAEQGIIRQSEAKKLVAGLKKILKCWEKDEFELTEAHEDVHGCIEAELKNLVGDVAGKLHSGRSRNDQVALDERLYLRDVAAHYIGLINEAIKAFVTLAESNIDAIMPSYTHLQRAQPVLFAHWCHAYIEMLLRDRRRFERLLSDSLSECPLGASALAGSSLPLDRKSVAKSLAFSKPTENSLDTVADRDHLLEFASNQAIMMIHLSRFAEEITNFNSQEFGFIELDDAFATGSSLMPQKKNPDVAELLRGKVGHSLGLVTQLFTLMKGLPLAYNRDMQEDKEFLFYTIDTMSLCLRILPEFLSAITVKSDVMRAACEHGFLDATDAADYLVEKNVPFREAHEVIGKIVRYCQKQQKTLMALSLNEWQSFHTQFSKDITSRLKLETVVSARKTYGGTAAKQVKAALNRVKKKV